MSTGQLGGGILGSAHDPCCPTCLQVTLIPTFDSVAMRRWYEETHAQHQALGIRVLGSGSMVFTEDDAFPACKLVF